MVASNYPNEDLPLILSGQLQSQAAKSGVYDILISGIPFRLRPTQEDPRLRQVDQGVKEQFDSSKEAGENSFGQWWLRSQSSFHGGAGQTYLDSSESEVSRLRYSTSEKVYPHVPGELCVAGQIASAASSRKFAEQVVWSAQPRLVTASSTSDTVHWADLPTLANAGSVVLGSGGTPAAMTSDGVRAYVAIADRIYRVNAGGTATHIYNLTLSGPTILGYAKQRLVACVGNKVYVLETDPAAPPAAAPAVHYTHPISAYAYTSIAEGPNGIYLAGTAGQKSDVASMSVAESAGSVVLGPPVVQLQFPPAEAVRAMFFYVGSLFALATSNGVRIGTFTPYGQPQMGALIPLGSAYSVTGSGTLIYVGVHDAVCLVDLATPVDSAGQYAYSRLHSGLGATSTDGVTGLVVYPSTYDLVFGVTAANRLISQTSFVSATEGTLTTSWCRFGTTEPKRLHYVTLEGDLIAGASNALTVVVESGNGDTKTLEVPGGLMNVEFGVDLPTAQAFRLSFTLRNGSTLRSWQMKALPAPRRYPMFMLPLDCHDLERPHTGEEVGYPGFAAERLAALFSLAQSSAQVTVTEVGTNTSYQAVVDRAQFRQEVAPTRGNDLGGVVTVMLRLV